MSKIFSLKNLINRGTLTYIEERKHKPTMKATGSKHSASKKGYKHNHRPSKGELKSQK